MLFSWLFLHLAGSWINFKGGVVIIKSVKWVPNEVHFVAIQDVGEVKVKDSVLIKRFKTWLWCCSGLADVNKVHNRAFLVHSCLVTSLSFIQMASLPCKSWLINYVIKMRISIIFCNWSETREKVSLSTKRTSSATKNMIFKVFVMICRIIIFFRTCANNVNLSPFFGLEWEARTSKTSQLNWNVF